MPTEAFSSYALFANGPLFVPMQHAQYLLDEAVNTKRKILQKYSQKTKIPLATLIASENSNPLLGPSLYGSNESLKIGMQQRQQIR